MNIPRLEKKNPALESSQLEFSPLKDLSFKSHINYLMYKSRILREAGMKDINIYRKLYGLLWYK